MKRTGSCVLLAILATTAFGVAPPSLPRPGKKSPPSRIKKRSAVEGDEESARGALLAQLTFDRRPSAILRAWSSPASKAGGKVDALGAEMELFQRRVTLGKWPEVKAYLAGLPKEEAGAAYKQLLRSLNGAPGASTSAAPASFLFGGKGGRGGGGFPSRPKGKRGTSPFSARDPAPKSATGAGSTARAEQNHFTPDDVLGLAAAAPTGLDRESLDLLGGIVATCLQGGTLVDFLVRRFKAEVARPDGALKARQAARVLAEAGQVTAVADFLPTLEKARRDADLEALQLLVRHDLGQHARDNKPAWQESAWSALQAILAVRPRPENLKEREEALKQAVGLAPRLKAELGEKWLQESFTRNPGRGMTILATIGALSAQGQEKQPQAPDARLKTLRLQKSAVEALLKAAPERAREWRGTLELLAHCWLLEAETSAQAPDVTADLRDSFARRFGGGLGGFGGGPGGFFGGPGGFGGFRASNDDPAEAASRSLSIRFQPLSPSAVLSVRPGPDWLASVREEARPKFRVVLCRLQLKANQEDEAFGHLEELARQEPRQARELAGEYLRVWAKNREARGPTFDPGGGWGGFPGGGRGGFGRGGRGRFGLPRGDSTPLTRSRHERNLAELADRVARLRKLPIGDLDEELLTAAFAACHSGTEVYRLDAIVKVFGPVADLQPRALAVLAQKMRENLAGVWRQQTGQQNSKARPSTAAIEQEVLRGYAVARATVEAGLKKFPEEWSLVLVRGALLHDEVDFLHSGQVSSAHAGRRLAAVREFERAAKLYASRVKELPESEHSTRVHEQWLAASLGAVDLGQVNEERLPELKQAARIRAALLSLPDDLAGPHLARFAGQLVANLQVVRPQVKYRYLKAGLEIVGDHKDADEARKQFAFYQDLLREVKLEARVDGPEVVGHRRPFGVYVQLRHTRDLERASGGLGRYTQNQGSAAGSFRGMFGPGLGGARGTDYRDRFQAMVTEALKEHFEVLSVTFETDKVRSRATRRAGWQITPYAYLLLKARGPQVDRLPSLRLDLDFTSSAGEVVLPVESPALVLDARPEQVEPRPVRRLEVTQTLDERQAREGKLLLEVKATGQGLVPELGRVLALAPEGFEIVRVDDPGVAVSRFDQDSDAITIVSERLWTVTLRARDGQGRLPTKFAFGQALAEGTKMHYQRYDDADLVKVSAVVGLEASYGKRRLAWPWWAGGGAVVLAAAGVLAWRRWGRRPAAGPARWALPEPLTPFTTIALLERIHSGGRLSEAERAEVEQTIRELERHYFAAGAGGNGQVDLAALAGGWVRRAR